MKINIHIFLIFATCVFSYSCSQEKEKKMAPQEYLFNENHWVVEDKVGSIQSIDTMIYDDKMALHLPVGHTAYLRNKRFKDFIIEFDVIGFVMPGVGFRLQDKSNYELIYIRINSNKKKDAIQYLPIYNASLPWQLYNYPKYEATAKFPKKKVTSLPMSFQKFFQNGTMNDTLRLKLKKENIFFSEKAEMQSVNDSLWVMGDRELLIQLELKKENTNWDVFNKFTWTHMKVKVLGDQATIYVEDMITPKLITKLKQGVKEGGISLKNQFYDAFFTNVSIEGLKEDEPILSDTNKEQIQNNFLTQWELSEKFVKNDNKILVQLDSLVQKNIKWKTIKSDGDGLVNISRFFNETSKTVAFRSTIHSASEQSVKMHFDYANHLIMVLNSRIIFNNGIGTENEGRVFINDENIKLNLLKGKNELLLVITADDFKQNWGFVAQLDSVHGISIK